MLRVLFLPVRKGTFHVQNTACRPKITVSADGTGLVSQAGLLLLAEALRFTGLGEGPSGALARWRAGTGGARSGEDPH